MTITPGADDDQESLAASGHESGRAVIQALTECLLADHETTDQAPGRR